ncbi:protein KRTCAP2 homolog [Drosophila guanche]|uniref:Blast:Pachytene checkpoint protein 2 homolog n=1 Tax=Drosophila guanche TaxID=7266 RepID=A0A3B0KH30_DROGU|nr:protein KRTCAP2 homolog [Drosophila guanche]SPP84401.1 blast:Pachytene checkpoint protein 2 homolog [Drosophila guanche]
MSASTSSKNTLVSSIISGILSLVIFATLRFCADWFNGSQLNVLVGGYLFSWLFILSLTCVSNAEMLIFGQDFQAKLVPEILFCMSLTVAAAGIVHRVCATTSILFSLVGLYFLNRISSKYYSTAVVPLDAPARKTAKKFK